MLGDREPSWAFDPVRAACAPFDLCTLELRRWDLLGHVGGAVDLLAAPVLYGAAAWLHCCRLTAVMRWLKADDSEGVELDPVG